VTQILIAGAPIERGQGIYFGNDGNDGMAYPIDSDKPKSMQEAVEKLMNEYNRSAKLMQDKASKTIHPCT